MDQQPNHTHLLQIINRAKNLIPSLIDVYIPLFIFKRIHNVIIEHIRSQLMFWVKSVQVTHSSPSQFISFQVNRRMVKCSMCATLSPKENYFPFFYSLLTSIWKISFWKKEATKEGAKRREYFHLGNLLANMKFPLFPKAYEILWVNDVWCLLLSFFSLLLMLLWECEGWMRKCFVLGEYLSL